MLSFEPKGLNEIKEQLLTQFPMPEDFALKDESYAFDLIAKLRSSEVYFSELSPTDLNYVYHLAKFCDEEEFKKLAAVFKKRATSALFNIGWTYCQINANEQKAIELFSVSCKWMREKKEEEYEKTLIGRTGLPWSEIYSRSVDIIKIDKLSIDEFCKKYNLMRNTLFYQQLYLIYLSKCEKEELYQNEANLAELITSSKIEFIRPALKNYTAKINYDEMSSLINDAISFRLSKESGDESLGLSPSMLIRIRQQRFNSILEGCCGGNTLKCGIYISVAGKIRNVELLTNGFFSINFGAWNVVDNVEWKDHAYAYLPQLYKRFVDDWTAEGFVADFWPGMDEKDIITAYDVFMGNKKGGVVKLKFNDFDLLYTKDLLSNARY